MNVLFLSPAFPPNAYLFCTALARRGVQVLGLGDQRAESLRPELVAALSAYVFEPGMGDYDTLRSAALNLERHHGRIDRLDSLGEHWLEAEGRLRDDLDVVGLSAAETARMRSKLAMAERFAVAGIPSPPSARCDDASAVRQLVQRHGYPVVVKPDRGSGAADTFAVDDADALTAVLATGDRDLVAQAFIAGDIVTFDGLVDRDGHIVFCISHAYDQGIMQVRRGRLDGYYYSLREIPPNVEAAGRAAVTAFGLRERFFHVELFVRADGSIVALEMNVRPPGGYTPEMMGLACDIDVHDLWAAIVTGASLDGFAYQRSHHVAHAGRRNGREYALTQAELVRELGATIVHVREVPPAFAVTMGDVAYLLRHDDRDALLAAITLVQAPA